MIKTTITAISRHPKILLMAGTLLPWIWTAALLPLWASLVSLAVAILSAFVLGLALSRNNAGASGDKQASHANVGDDLSALLPRWSGMAHKTHDELHDVRNQIHGVMQQTEQAVLNISGCFRNITDKTNEQMKYAMSLLQTTHGLEPQKDDALPYRIYASDAALNAVADEIVRFAGSSLHLAANQESMKAMTAAADSLLNKTNLIIRKIMAVSASQNRLAPAAIAERLATLGADAEEINQLNMRMSEHLQAIQQGLNHAYEDIRGVSSKAMTVAAGIKHNIVALSETAAKKNREVMDMISHINRLGEEVRKDIYKIIIDLQFQDITHQKLEHVKTPLLNELGQGLRAIAEETHIIYEKLRQRFIGNAGRSRDEKMSKPAHAPEIKGAVKAGTHSSFAQSNVDNKVELF